MQGLKKFVAGNFTRWVAVNLNDLERLVVDGDSICSQLYSKVQPACWLLGGEYAQFQTTVKEFFSEILFTGVQVLVVFSGVEKEQPGAESVYHRNTRFNEAVRHAQARTGWVNAKERRVPPLMVRAVFMDILHTLEIDFRVANTDARREVAAFANHYKCPVLASASDFFVFELQAGYIPFEKLSTVIASGFVYHTKEFLAEFLIEDPKLLLLLVQFMEGAETDADFTEALGKVWAHKTCEKYFISESHDDEVHRKFDVLKEYYCDTQLPLGHDPKSDDVTAEISPDLPKWIAHGFNAGRFEPQLINVHLNSTCVLPTLVEDMNRDSAWLASRSIRQHMYGFIGVPEGGSVKEIIRAKSSPEVSDVQVTPCNLSPPLSLGDLAGDKKTMEKLVLEVLTLHKHKLSQEDLQHEFGSLKDQWKLPIAAAFYWYQNCDNPAVQRHLVKSLLLSFLTCSGAVQNKVPSLEPVTRSTKPDVLTAVHAFALWQCVYYDAVALNYLAREPFRTTSPAFLYSGEVAMHYASFARKNLSVDGVLMTGSEEWWLYNKFLYLVTGCDTGGRIGSHAKHRPKSRAPALSVPEEAPLLKETNRYALLSDSA